MVFNFTIIILKIHIQNPILALENDKDPINGVKRFVRLYYLFPLKIITLKNTAKSYSNLLQFNKINQNNDLVT